MTMTIDDKTLDEERLMQLARDKQGFYKGQKGFYIGTANRGDDGVLLSPTSGTYRDQLLKVAQFWVDELGYPGMELLDLASIQIHDVIAGPFEDRQTAIKVLPYVIKVRYLGK